MTRRRKALLAIGLVLAIGVAFGLVWFQPWKLFVDETVNERLPDVALETPAAEITRAATAPTTTPSAASAASAAPTPTLLSRGTFISHEHDTSGTVSVVRQADGSRVLAIADLNTSNGPDVHVWLTDAPVRTGENGWHVFDDGAHISLGTLKGNLGNQVYAIPRSANLSKLTSVTIWCARFDVSFGAAELAPVG